MQSESWPQRPLVLAVLGAVCAVIIHFLTDDLNLIDPSANWRVSIASAITVFGLGFAICARGSRLASGVVYALCLAAVAGGIIFWRLQLGWSDQYSSVALGLSFFIFSPYYQASLHTHWRDYRALHQHAWGNAVVFALGLVFMWLSFGLAYLLAALFSLVGIDVLEDLLREDIVRMVLRGTALGASIGVLREHDSIIASTQALVQSVFSLLVVPLALGLGIFLPTLLFTSLEPLWGGSISSSVILFVCAVGALIILNAVIREDDANQSKNRIVHIASRILALTVAPLALITVFSLKLRIDQYGLTPDRMWAAVVCLVLTLYGIGYFLSTCNRRHFYPWVRSCNLYLGVVVSALAILLATPLMDFSGVSISSQLERFENGTTAENDLDIVAFAFDFGPAGRSALEQLSATSTPQLKARIDLVLEQKGRWNATRLDESKSSKPLKEILKVIPDTRDVPDDFLEMLRAQPVCKEAYCYLLWPNNDNTAVIVNQRCNASNSCRPEVILFKRTEEGWSRDFSGGHFGDNAINGLNAKDTVQQQLESAAQRGEIELRPVQRMQVFIEDTPIGPTISD